MYSTFKVNKRCSVCNHCGSCKRKKPSKIIHRQRNQVKRRETKVCDICLAPLDTLYNCKDGNCELGALHYSKKLR